MVANRFLLQNINLYLPTEEELKEEINRELLIAAKDTEETSVSLFNVLSNNHSTS